MDLEKYPPTIHNERRPSEDSKNEIEIPSRKRGFQGLRFAPVMLLFIIGVITLSIIPTCAIVFSSADVAMDDLTLKVIKGIVILITSQLTDIFLSVKSTVNLFGNHQSTSRVLSKLMTNYDSQADLNSAAFVAMKYNDIDELRVSCIQRSNLTGTVPQNSPSAVNYYSFYLNNYWLVLEWCDYRNTTMCFCTLWDPVEQKPNGQIWTAQNDSLTPTSIIDNSLIYRKFGNCGVGGSWFPHIQDSVPEMIYANCFPDLDNFYGGLSPYVCGARVGNDILFEVLRKLTPTPETRIFLATRGGDVLATNRNVSLVPEVVNNTSQFVTVGSTQDSVMNELATILLKNETKWSNLNAFDIANNPISISSNETRIHTSCTLKDGSKWNTATVRVSFNTDNEFIIVISIPETELNLIGIRDDSQMHGIIISLVFGIIGVGMGMCLTFLILSPMYQMTVNMEKVTRFDFSVLGTGELREDNMFSEIRVLQRTFNMMVKGFAGAIKNNKSVTSHRISTISEKSPFTSTQSQDSTVLFDEKSVSRSHAKISIISNSNSLLLTDNGSKFGTFISNNNGSNWERVAPNIAENILDGCLIRFGVFDSIIRCKKNQIVACCSGIKPSSRSEFAKAASKYGITITREITKETTHLVLSAFKVTGKVVSALAHCQYIVNEGWLQNLINTSDYPFAMPKETDFLPDLRNELNEPFDARIWSPNLERRTLFLGYAFVVYSEKQFNTLRMVIEPSGGKVLRWTPSTDANSLETLLSSTGAEMNILFYPEPELKPYRPAIDKVKSQRPGMRYITENDIAYSMLFVSTAYCDPFTPTQIPSGSVPRQQSSGNFQGTMGVSQVRVGTQSQKIKVENESQISVAHKAKKHSASAYLDAMLDADDFEPTTKPIAAKPSTSEAYLKLHTQPKSNSQQPISLASKLGIKVPASNSSECSKQPDENLNKRKRNDDVESAAAAKPTKTKAPNPAFDSLLWDEELPAITNDESNSKRLKHNNQTEDHDDGAKKAKKLGKQADASFDFLSWDYEPLSKTEKEKSENQESASSAKESIQLSESSASSKSVEQEKKPANTNSAALEFFLWDEEAPVVSKTEKKAAKSDTEKKDFEVVPSLEPFSQLMDVPLPEDEDKARKVDEGSRDALSQLFDEDDDIDPPPTQTEPVQRREKTAASKALRLQKTDSPDTKNSDDQLPQSNNLPPPPPTTTIKTVRKFTSVLPALESAIVKRRNRSGKRLKFSEPQFIGQVKEEVDEEEVDKVWMGLHATDYEVGRKCAVEYVKVDLKVSQDLKEKSVESANKKNVINFKPFVKNGTGRIIQTQIIPVVPYDPNAYKHKDTWLKPVPIIKERKPDVRGKSKATKDSDEDDDEDNGEKTELQREYEELDKLEEHDNSERMASDRVEFANTNTKIGKKKDVWKFKGVSNQQMPQSLSQESGDDEDSEDDNVETSAFEKFKRNLTRN